MVSRASENIQLRTQELGLQRTRTAQSDAPYLGEIDGHYEMLVEHPFDSTIKRMSTVWQFIPEDSNNDPAQYDLIVRTSALLLALYSPPSLQVVDQRDRYQRRRG